MTRPIGIDLFAGAGGMSLGFEQAGFDVAAAVEIDPVHCAVHKFNFPECAVIPRSVVGLSASEIRRAANLGKRKIDCVFGGPPCQGFSLIGHRALDDPRNNLVREFVRLVAELDSETFVFENVKGLTVGRHRQFLEELVREFESAGYDVRTPWRVFDTAWFGVPQHRERLILVGSKRGRKLPEYPASSSVPADSDAEVGELAIGPNCEDALGDLPDAEAYPTLEFVDVAKPVRYTRPSGYAELMRCTNDAGWFFGDRRDWDRLALTSSWQTGHTDISRRRFAATRPGETEPISRFFKLAPDGLSNTLRAGTDGARGAFTSPRPIHYKFNRCITVREMARLHGFPDWFRLHSTKWHGARQIGNAVPPPFARTVASKIVEVIGRRPVVSQRTIPLGDDALLYLETGAAADYFGVERPVTRRDRKSGAKKRKQEEIEAGQVQGF